MLDADEVQAAVAASAASASRAGAAGMNAVSTSSLFCCSAGGGKGRRQHRLDMLGAGASSGRLVYGNGHILFVFTTEPTSL